MGRSVLGFPFLLTCIHLQVLPIDWTSAIVGTGRMQLTVVSLRKGSEGRKAQDQHISQQLILFFISALMLWISQGLLLSFLMIYWMFFYFFLITFYSYLTHEWITFLPFLKTPHMCGLCFIQVAYSVYVVLYFQVRGFLQISSNPWEFARVSKWGL